VAFGAELDAYRAIVELLGIPPTVSINRVIGFGHVDPDRAAAPPSVGRRRGPLSELVHWETWSPST